MSQPVILTTEYRLARGQTNARNAGSSADRFCHVAGCAASPRDGRDLAGTGSGNEMSPDGLGGDAVGGDNGQLTLAGGSGREPRRFETHEALEDYVHGVGRGDTELDGTTHARVAGSDDCCTIRHYPKHKQLWLESSSGKRIYARKYNRDEAAAVVCELFKPDAAASTGGAAERDGARAELITNGPVAAVVCRLYPAPGDPATAIVKLYPASSPEPGTAAPLDGEAVRGSDRGELTSSGASECASSGAGAASMNMVDVEPIHLQGTTQHKPPRGCRSWIDFWEKVAARPPQKRAVLPTMCPCRDSDGTAHPLEKPVGAHVVFQGRDLLVYCGIVPTCSKCNTAVGSTLSRGRDIIFPCTIAVVADPGRQICHGVLKATMRGERAPAIFDEILTCKIDRASVPPQTSVTGWVNRGSERQERQEGRYADHEGYMFHVASIQLASRLCGPYRSVCNRSFKVPPQYTTFEYVGAARGGRDEKRLS